MKTTYEWAWELTDAAGDVIDLDFADTFTKCREIAPAEAEFALVRRLGDDDEGEVDRSYTYCQPATDRAGLELPDRFDDGYKVPQRFHAEIARASQ